MPRNPPDDKRIAHGAHRLTVAQSNALYAVAIAALLRELRGDVDLPRCRPSLHTSVKHAHSITAHSATLRGLEIAGLIAQPYRRVWGQSSGYGPCPVLTPHGREALDSRWADVVCRTTDLRLDAIQTAAEFSRHHDECDVAIWIRRQLDGPPPQCSCGLDAATRDAAREAGRLRAALLEYGRHDDGCALTPSLQWGITRQAPPGTVCDCGLDAAREAAK